MKMYKPGLQGKAILGLGGLLLVALSATGGVAYWQGLEIAEKNAMHQALDGVDHLAEQIEIKMAEARHSLMIVRDTPPIQAIIRTRDAGGIDPLTGDSLALWEKRLQIIFASFISQLPQIQQFRYLDEQGNELVRVDGINARTHVVAADRLQNKANHSYFHEGIKLGKDAVYISDMDLNEEQGKIQEPHMPVLRMATPVFDDKGNRRGLLVVNILGQALFADLGQGHKKTINYIINQHGFFLHHPDMSRTFGFDLGFDYALRDEYPKLAAQILGGQENGVAHYKDVGKVEAFRKLFFDGMDRKRFIVLVSVIPDAVVFAGVRDSSASVLFAMFVIIVFSLLMITWLVNRHILTPVVHLAAAAGRMGQGDLSVRLSELEVSDEFNVLYRALNGFAENQQHATEQLEQHGNYLNCIVDSTVDGLITIDAMGKVQRFNPAAERIFGYAADEVIGRNVKMLMPEPYQSGHDGYLHHFHATGEKKVIGIGRQVKGLRKDGSIFPLDLAVSEIGGDKAMGYIGVVRDITEQYQALKDTCEREQRMNLQQESYAALSRHIGSTGLNIEHALRMLTKDASHTLGVKRAGIWFFNEKNDLLSCDNLYVAGSETPSKIADLHRNDFPLYFQALEGEAVIAAVDACTDPRTAEFVECYLKPLEIGAMLDVPIMHEGRVAGVLCVEHQGSARQWHADEIVFGRTLSSLVSLLLEIKSRQDTEHLLQQQNVELERANRLKSDFLANMSHELRTPLNAIIGFSEVMRDGLAGEMNEEQLGYSGDIFDSGHHLLALINDILDLSKIEAGKMDLQCEEAMVKELAQASLTIVREKAASHGISLSMAVDSRLPDVVHVDARKVKQMMFNLLSNAVKFSPNGGEVKLALKLATRDGTDLLPDATQWLEIAVSDQGIGISEADMSRLFQSFQQLENPMTKSHEGTGLGLTLVKRLAELHGGDVSVSSTLGEGSCFTICLPILDISKPEEKAIIGGSAGLGRRKSGVATGPKVLVIEDDPMSATLLLLQLEQSGYRCDCVGSAEKAIIWLQTERPDIITVDIMLPGMDGWDFLVWIKQNKQLKSIPVVIVSIVADEQQAFALGASQVLIKPVQKKALLQAVASLSLTSEKEQLTVLAVDDDAKSLKLIERHMRAEGFIVLKALGGQQGIDLAKAHIPDLIVLDLMMPGISGFEVVEELKCMPGTASIPIMILTAKEITAEDRQRLNGDIVKIIQKRQFHLGDFLEELHRVAGNHPEYVTPEKEKNSPYVLVIEGDIRTAKVLKDMLLGQGYDVAHAVNGILGLEMMQSRCPALVLLDMMQKENSPDFLQQKGGLDAFKHVPVLMISSDEGSSKMGMDAGADAFLSKPFDRDMLLQTVSRLVHSPDIKQAGTTGSKV